MRSCLLLLFIAQVAFARHRIPSPHRRTFESRDRSLDTTPPFAERALADNIAALLGAPMNSLIAGISQAATALESLGFGPPDMAGIENGLGPGQDPDAVSRLEPDASGRRAEGNLTYYFVTNDFARGIYMLKSQDLNSIFADPSSEKQIFEYDKAVGTEAPSLFEWSEGRWLIYVSSVGAEGNGSMRVLQAKSDDLWGDWEDLGEMRHANGDRLTNYDGHAFRHPNGKRYFTYSALRSVEIAELTSPTTVGRATVWASGDGERTIEAPGSFVSGQKLNIIWSENVFAQPDYNTINRAISVDDDPLDPASWRNSANVTFLRSGNGVYGPGSACVYNGPDERPWIAYSAFYMPQGFPLTENPRRVQTQPLIVYDDEIQPMAPDRPTRFLD
ncbi:Arabinanase/levansucrase/invertase [Tilletiopsis washingtonensis]|uniref:Arabinanase/levansucrase/invertase n=1 Tax=Tilletiopsis washingtonensis TaxID=58919 RepID=A0A316ZJ19_9BASI|nr:Arabinanase/levansucrase/invertase [Tilletiopsis washingtonensis]PWO01045.1 Arabinanase/levansucrase/invertase [Tilletiopsis washingtonensis]